MKRTIEEIRVGKMKDVSEKQYFGALILLELKEVLIKIRIKNPKKEFFTYYEIEDIIENLKF